ncbi:DUF2793 domain-containing protein [Mesorhizobium microcysteis]|uniref:DUF2793 domain-containing protein n=1 Tax=Neoaquamicrobium microcysteis TaxID=2682781 RepID=A0A5D4H622_9HYPH|nr:DUF2793 domain-containing protein [Mesorhizobium microcysteis]TYR34895.1 DUF2793 domain-containing protein [Mesorhizobium microcysteis]
MEETANLSLPYIMPSQAQKHVTHNEALRMLDAIVQLSVVDRDRASPPAEPSDGQRHIVGDDAVDAWEGRESQVAAWQDGGWTFLSPRTGWLAWVAGEQALLAWDGSTWLSVGAQPMADSLEMLGVGTMADAENPFAARLNAALWTARYDAEGGNGDLRYVLNKEMPAGMLSVTMQTGWSGRAEIGLLGDDHLGIKVSPDGETWTQAMRVDAASGNMRVKSISVGTDSADGHFMTLLDDTGANMLVDLYANGNTGLRSTRYSDNANGPIQAMRKARGTLAAPAAVQSGDLMGSVIFNYYTGATFNTSARIDGRCVASSPSGGDGESRIEFAVAPASSGAASEIMRLDHAAGLSMFGANPVIDANRHHRLRPYTVAGLPSASPAGQLVYVSNGSANRRLAVSDGSSWRFPDGAVVS